MKPQNSWRSACREWEESPPEEMVLIVYNSASLNEDLQQAH